MSVTMLDPSSWTAAERQAAARDAYRASGHRLSGAELGRRFGRSGRWGRAQIEAVATEDRAAATGNPAVSGTSPAAATDGTPNAEDPRAAATGRTGGLDTSSVAATGGAKAAEDPGVAATRCTTGLATAEVAATTGEAGTDAGTTTAAGHPAEPDVPPAVRWASAGAVVAVAFVAAVASYTHPHARPRSPRRRGPARPALADLG
jgi:hypothetical protein